MDLKLTFQSTRPHGARLGLSGHKAVPLGFNPRAHTGRDDKKWQVDGKALVFQSTRPHGARQASTL